MGKVIINIKSGEQNMNKYLAIMALLSVVVTTQTMAYDPPSTQMYSKDVEITRSEQYAFIGVGAGYSDSFEKNTLLDLRMGMQNSVWRTMFTYESNFDIYQSLLIEVDRTVVAGLMGGKGRIYLGLSGGWVMFSDDRVDDNIVVEWEDYGYAYGGNIGLMYYISDQVDLSIGYRYLKVKDICGAESCLKDNINGLEVALHYFF
jgi:opacity protein-like surface antigen